MAMNDAVADDRIPPPATETAPPLAPVSRPAAASRNAGALVAEWRSLAALTPVVGEWRALAARALEPNAFYEPSFALAAAPVYGRNAGAVLVWLRDAPRQLLGFFPARIERRRYGVAKPVLVGWTHPYGPYGTPLVDRAAAEPVIDAWLAHVTRTANLPKLMLLPFVHDGGPFSAALDAVLAARRIPAVDFNRHGRALLAPDAATVAPEAEAGAARAVYLARAVPGRRLKELRRQRRRLAETGELAFTTVRGVFGIDEALADFMMLEAAGWKGRSRTATAHRHDIRRFVEVAVRGLAGDGKARIDRMQLDGRTLAASVTLRSGDAAFFWKIAYDETFARYSPGVLLTLELTEQLLADDAIARTDSCATAGHPMIDRLWRERLPLVDRLIGLRPDAGLAVAKHLETSRRGIIAAAKRLRDLVRL